VFDSLERPLNENMNEMQMDCFEGGVNASKRCLQSAYVKFDRKNIILSF
jgi:hypothetical protein